jgi:8-oxo-dGTP pyrophosphatase MutT (NUDIX family)
MAAPAPTLVQALPADWRARLRRRLLTRPEHRLEHCRPAGLAGDAAQVRARLAAHWPVPLKIAAVLVPIIDRAEEPALLMTVRASHLRRHAGQISFPGGRLEARDADVVATAMRETAEEIGVGAAGIEPIGFLADHVVQSGYRITPVVALLQPGLTLEPQRTEVAEVFELPLAVVLRADSYRVGRRMLGGLEVSSWELAFGQYHIWGATAGILANLREAYAGDVS